MNFVFEILTSTLAFLTAHFCVHTYNNNNKNTTLSEQLLWCYMRELAFYSDACREHLHDRMYCFM
jgi:hypothetical protein